MKKKILSILSVVLCTMVGYSSTVFAEDTVMVEEGVTEVVYYTYVDSLFTITLPTEIPLVSGEVTNAVITAEGDIAGEQILSVDVDETVELSAEGKNSVTAAVEISKTEFTSEELLAKSSATIRIDTPELSAGVWEGNLTVYASVEYNDELTDSGNIIGFSDLEEQTLNGLTYSITDNTITINGTATDTTEINLWDSMISDPLVAGEIYTFAYKVNSGTTTGNEDIKYMYTGSNVIAVTQNGTTVTLATDQIRCKIKVTSGTTYDNYTFNLWAVEGSEFKHYQKYGEENSSSEIDSSVFILEVSDTVTKVETYHTKGETLSFVLMADSHVYPNYDTNNSSVLQYESTLANIKSVNDVVGIDGLVHLGDHVNTQWLWANHAISNAEYHSRIYYYANKLKDTGIGPLYLVPGNHDADFLPNEESSGTEYTTYTSLYSNLGAITDSTTTVVRPVWTGDVLAPYYYTDYEDQKIRCIFICTNMENANNEVKGIPYNEVVWFKSVLESTPSDYDILLFGHIPFSMFYSDITTASSDTQSFIEILNAYNNATTWDGDGSTRDVDFTGNTSKILAYFCGHYHGERAIMPDDANAVLSCPEIVIPSSNYIFTGVINSGDYFDNVDMPTKTYGTATQDVFDVMTYSPNENKIYLTRFGAGADRVIDLE